MYHTHVLISHFLFSDNPNYTETRSDAVFANNEISLGDIDIYGFDYDYTLALYKPALHSLIYKLGGHALVENLKYPKEILSLDYKEDFAVRGCHYDVRKGLLMKLDSFHNIQLGTVYKGTRQLSDTAVKSLYNGTHVALDDMNSFYGTGPLMYQLVDLFAPPEMILLTNITDFFLDNNIPYDPEYVFHDVRSSVQGVHNSGALHSAIMQDLDTYVDKGNEIKALLESLVQNSKKLFLITNSGFPFVPFRMLDPTTQNESYDRVYRLVQGKVYQQDPSLKSGWRTGAIIPELEKETLIMNSADYHTAVNWLGQLENLIEISQMDKSPETSSIRKQWLDERHELRNYTKSLFNPLFGSIFRTYHNPTYFTRRLARFADLYMSSVVNLMQYSPDHTFYPRRMALPHEPHNMDN
ncbi:hypothetical protein FSP39_020452 [Pinctada imbricata]|uniref:Uncharacterized protein n=1 Tax=Pinctada imbricata TaxID=66713 RepID=A0AA89BZ46_PINIB|nr:hypothetical protein FSP39_020452 [Pinctada imbricata]